MFPCPVLPLIPKPVLSKNRVHAAVFGSGSATPHKSECQWQQVSDSKSVTLWYGIFLKYVLRPHYPHPVQQQLLFYKLLLLQQFRDLTYGG